MSEEMKSARRYVPPHKRKELNPEAASFEVSSPNSNSHNNNNNNNNNNSKQQQSNHNNNYHQQYHSNHHDNDKNNYDHDREHDNSNSNNNSNSNHHKSNEINNYNKPYPPPPPSSSSQAFNINSNSNSNHDNLSNRFSTLNLNQNNNNNNYYNNNNNNENRYNNSNTNSNMNNYNNSRSSYNQYEYASNQGPITNEKDLFSHEHEVTQGINFEQYDAIPVECSGYQVPKPIENFQSSGLYEQLLSNVYKCGYSKPTPIQKYAISCVINNRDLMACAQTGSGKTAAFLLPIIHGILFKPNNNNNMNQNHNYNYYGKVFPKALILSPTRELSIQIYEQSRKFLYKTNLKSCVVYGGAPRRQQAKQLTYGCDILVATPGRIYDFMEKSNVDMKNTLYLVLDEADRMLDMGFMPQIQQIIHMMPPKENRQTLMFSATFPLEIQKLAQTFLNNYVFLAIGRVGSTNNFIKQKLKYVEKANKMNELIRMIPECEGLKLIFVETRKDADIVEKELIREGFDAISIHGDRTQAEREHALKMFRNGQINILVATDVAARGLDIPNVIYVINYDLPNNIDSYVHRIGRTGRCGNDGNSISFVNNDNKPILKDLFELLQETKQDVPQWFNQLLYENNSSSYNYSSSNYYHSNHYHNKNYNSNSNNNSNSNYNNHYKKNGYSNNSTFASRDYRHHHKQEYNNSSLNNNNNNSNSNSNANPSSNSGGFASKREYINGSGNKVNSNFNDKDMVDSW